MEIRYINSMDNPLEISNIYESSWKYAYKGIIPQDYLNSIPPGHWANNVNRADMHNLVILENNQVIGTASICKSRWEKYSDYGEIVSIYLLPEYIGRGYGQHLFKVCVDELTKMGFDKILLWVLEENQRARKFYEKNGLVCTDAILDDNIGGKDLREMMYILGR